MESGRRRTGRYSRSQFEGGARRQPDYEWSKEELILVDDSDCLVEEAEVGYDEVRAALGLESLEE